MQRKMFYGAYPQTFRKASWLRSSQTESEKVLWPYLKALGKTWGFRFKRQHPIGDYIADFYCHKHKLVIELDGFYHQSVGQQADDRRRDHELSLLGIFVLRFTDKEVIADPRVICEKVIEKLSSAKSHRDDLSSQHIVIRTTGSSYLK
jgi:imidazole glycerol-phosphate synthase subunit HisF